MNQDQSTTITPQSIPQPAGYTDDGQPYWFVDGQKYFWAEFQQVLWQWMQKQQAASTTSSGKGAEGMPQMPTVSLEQSLNTLPDQLDTNINRTPDRNFEKRESGIETAAESGDKQSQGQSAPVVVKKDEPKAPTLIGDSPKLTVATNDPVQMQEFIAANEEGSAKSSNTFLAVFLKKILQALTATE